MRVDEARHDEFAAGVDGFDVTRRAAARCRDVGDDALADQNVRVVDWRPAGPVDERAALNQQRLAGPFAGHLRTRAGDHQE